MRIREVADECDGIASDFMKPRCLEIVKGN